MRSGNSGTAAFKCRYRQAGSSRPGGQQRQAAALACLTLAAAGLLVLLGLLDAAQDLAHLKLLGLFDLLQGGPGAGRGRSKGAPDVPADGHTLLHLPL